MSKKAGEAIEKYIEAIIAEKIGRSGLTINEFIEKSWQAPKGSVEKDFQLWCFPNKRMPTKEELIKKIIEINYGAST